MKIIYHNRNPVSPAPDFPAKYCETLDELLAEADAVSLHMPLNGNTEKSFGAEQFKKMKDGSVLINTARGGVMDQEALLDALNSGKVSPAYNLGADLSQLFSAGLDVFPNEYVDPVSHRLTLSDPKSMNVSAQTTRSPSSLTWALTL